MVHNLRDDIMQEEGMAPHVIVVDDDPRLRRLLQRYLSEHGFRISVAASAAEARQALGEFSRMPWCWT